MLTTRELITTLYNALDNKLKKHRGNWEQNDPTAKDYIKNRPFYTDESKRVDIVKETSFSGSSPRGAPGPSIYQAQIPIVPGSQLINNTTYTVVFDGVTYNCTPYLFDGIMVIGDEGMVYGNPSGTEPFLFAIMDKVTGLIIYARDGTHTVSIYSEKIKKIDKKYLPDDINVELPELADVAYSGNYYDLEDTPTIYNDIVRYSATQNLTNAQKTTARNNIGAADVTSTNGMLKYTAQTLTDAQKEQAKKNIGVENQVQSNWNTYDIEDKSYILNRPFYDDIIEGKEVLSKGGITSTAGWSITTNNSTSDSFIHHGNGEESTISENLIIGEEYKCYFGVNEFYPEFYIGTYNEGTGNGIKYGYIGNGALLLKANMIYNTENFIDNGNDFCIIWELDDKREIYHLIIRKNPNTGMAYHPGYDYKLSSIKQISYAFKSIDEKFIPDSIQRTITGTSGDFVVIGDDGNVTTKTVPNAEEVAF